MSTLEILIGGLRVGPDAPPMVIAEMSANHLGSLEKALNLVEEAKKAGAHALKLQTYTADTMTLDLKEGEFSVRDPKSLWNGKTLYELYREAATPWEWHAPIFERCKKLGLIAFSSPFDASAVEFLEKLNVPCYKIASFENTDIPLIRRVAATGKPVILSTGMATLEELKESVAEARRAGCRDIILLKCTSVYPADPQEANVLTIPDMREKLDCLVGVSDHTMGIGVALAAVAMGAVVIEKHFALSRAEAGVDTAFSMEPAEMKQLVEESRKAWESLGKVNYSPTEKEKASLVFRRSLYVVRDMKKGEKITAENVRAIRPGLGLPPKHYDAVLGKATVRELKKGTPLAWEMIR